MMDGSMLLHSVFQDVLFRILAVFGQFTYHQLIVLFFHFSAFGWLLETVHRYFQNRQIVNPGFLSGPYLPIYGFSGFSILIIYALMADDPLWIRILVYFFSIAFIEFTTGYALLSLFGKRYWDYSDDFLNIQGHVCLLYTVIWVVLAIGVEKIVYPVSMQLFQVVSPHRLLAPAYFIQFIFLFDFIKSCGWLQKLLLILQRELSQITKQ